MFSSHKIWEKIYKKKIESYNRRKEKVQENKKKYV